MAYKVTESGNYVYFQEVGSSSKPFSGTKKELEVLATDAENEWEVTGIIQQGGIIVTTEDDALLDSTDTPFTPETWKTFYESNTGKSSGGDTPTETYQVFRGILYKEDSSTDAPILIESENTIGELSVVRNYAGLYTISGFATATENKLQAYSSAGIRQTLVDGTVMNVSDVDGEISVLNLSAGTLADGNFRISLRIELTL